jgi:hypothetical protein
MPGQDCVASCEGEINGSGPVCQKLGITALTCLTPFFQPGLSCDAAINIGLGKCGPAVAAFQNCKTPTMVPTPAPTPTPLPPMPTMPPMIDVGSCLVTAGAVDPSNCKMSFSCPNGGFETYCSATPDGSVKNCACLGPSGQMASGVIKNVPEVCQLAATMLCRFP